MRHFMLRQRVLSFAHIHAGMSLSFGVVLLIGMLLVSCAGFPGGTTGKQTSSQRGKDGTAKVATPRPTPTPFPTPQHGSIILDLQPASTGIVGKANCIDLTQIFECHVKIVARASNAGPLNWTAFTTIPGSITFTPSSGVLAPGDNILVSIFVPDTICTHGSFSFRGPSNTRTVAWACA